MIIIRKILYVLLLCLCCSTAFSQTLQLKEFVQREFDLSARRYLRTDVNGDTCALVKVMLAVPQAEFKGQIAGDTELKVSTYWVYMSPGSKRLSVSVPGFLPLDIEFAKYGIKSLASQTTYVATIEVPTELLGTIKSKPRKDVFIKKNSIYLGGGFSLVSSSGATFLAGGTIYNVNAEISYTLGVGESSEVGWYANGSDALTEIDTYKLNCLSFKLGYQIPLVSRFGITPQIGYKVQMLKSSGNRGDGASCGNATVGAKLLVPIIKNMRIFVEPEYALAIQKSDTYANIAKIAKFEEGGFYITGGLIFNF